MKVAIGADHAGYSLKEELRARLLERGHEVIDLGTCGPDSTDYPDYAAAVGRRVAEGSVDRGVLICSTGVGMSIAANKIPGVRAALAVNADEVHLTRAHNDANVLAFGARYTTVESGLELIDIFFDTPFDGGRHQRRVDKITALEVTAGEDPEDTQP
jgi:ribose 5-phosphate isomerase B